jgi:ribosomal protein L11 methyltransferase
MQHAPPALETVSVEVPEHALEAFEAALGSACDTVGFFRDEATGTWRVEGVRRAGAGEPALTAALLLAETLTGVLPALARTPVPSEGWLARSYAGFPEQRIGRRFAVRGSHVTSRSAWGRLTLTLDAGLAFGSGEHGSTRGCLRALEAVRRPPRRVLDLGTGSGILAIAAARLWRARVRAVDIEPWSVRLARRNARRNGVGRLVDARLADGWRGRFVRAGAPYDLVLANILARPLNLMAKHLAVHLALGGAAILSGQHAPQARGVLAAHRRAGLVLARRIEEGNWATLVVCKPHRAR